jgi:DNA (cytosine-5)-methyltransferase 1
LVSILEKKMNRIWQCRLVWAISCMMTEKKQLEQDLMLDEEIPVVVDLFCGAGGLSYGLQSAGLKISTGVDLDPNCKFALENNTSANFVCDDITNISVDQISTWFGKAKTRVLAGCAPCQPFSTYSQSRKSVDNRWNLLQQFQRLALGSMPEFVTMENVVGLAKQDVWKDFVSSLTDVGYSVSWRIVECKKFEVPQTRRRLVLIGSRLGPVELADPVETNIVTVKDAIGELPPIAAGETSEGDPLHSSSSLAEINLERIKHSQPGGTWRDWPSKLRAKCHQKESGKSYPSVYGRMEWDKPAPTITTQCYGYGNGRFGHPEQDRAISLREAAIIQSFPQSYRFLDNDREVSFSHLGTLIGNAVPPKLGEAIGKCIITHLLGATASVKQQHSPL